MKQPWGLAILLVSGLAGACAPRAPAVAPGAPMRGPESLRVQVVERGRPVIRRVALSDYVASTILSEFAPAAGNVAEVERMYQVQSIISRTYAVAQMGRHARDGFDLCSTTHCQLYEPGRLQTSRWAATAVAAEHQTRGQVLWFGAAPARALYHADCGGRTSDAAMVWGGQAVPYLRAVRDDDGPGRDAHAAWRFDSTRDAVRRALNASPATAVGTRLGRLTVIERDDSGRALRVAIDGEQSRQVRGDDVRAALAQAFGYRSIRSTQFEIAEDRDAIVFEGRGFGHGVGLCQAGAFARLKAGARVMDVLARYYPGTSLRTLKR